MSMDSVTELYVKAAYEGGAAMESPPRDPSALRSRIAMSLLCLGIGVTVALPVAAVLTVVEIGARR
ncbi:hypothetical protein ACFQ4O_09415 [Methylopila musalis]|uniref:Uncharacterized protein n=1 Tax=Methylopila musalis TaxID=1134781 RepID=A0ABW3Z7G4_9HYPH